MLWAQLDDPLQNRCRVTREVNEGLERQGASLTRLRPDGSRTWNGQFKACEAISGTLRLARRGNKVHFLFANNDSEVFRLLRTAELSDQVLAQNGLELRVICNGDGMNEVVWKNVTLRAEELKYLPPQTEDPPLTLSVMDADGSDPVTLTPPVEGFTELGSPEWSPNGNRIALDMSRGSTQTSHIVVLNADGSGLEDLGPGCMPSFSSDGKRIVFSQPGKGIVMMDADGANRRVVAPNGWGVQFSPDGKSIAYGESGNIILMNIETKTIRPLLTGNDADRYSSIYWNLSWSHDSRSIAFKARTRETGDMELAAVDVDNAGDIQVLYSGNGEISPDITWAPDNDQVLFTMHRLGHEGRQLFLVSRATPNVIKPFPGQPEGHNFYNCAWSRDGEQIALTSKKILQPVDWPVSGH